MSLDSCGDLQHSDLDKLLQQLRGMAPGYKSDWAGLDYENYIDASLKLGHQYFVALKGADRIADDYKKFEAGTTTITGALANCTKACDEAIQSLEKGTCAEDVKCSLMEKVTSLWDYCKSFLAEHPDMACSTDATTPGCTPTDCVTADSLKAVNENLKNFKQNFDRETEKMLKSMETDATKICDYNTYFATAAVAGAVWKLVWTYNAFEENSAQLQIDTAQLTSFREKVLHHKTELEKLIQEAKGGSSIDAVGIAVLHMEVVETQKDLQEIHDGLKKRRDAAASSRNGGILSFVANGVQAVLVSQQASALQAVVKYGYAATKLFGVAAAASAATAAIAHYDVKRLDETLVDVKKLLVMSTQHLKAIKELTQIMKPVS